MRRQVLIHRVAIAVVIHVVPAEQHLSRRSAVHEDHAGLLPRGFRAARIEQLTVDHHPIGGLELDLLRRYERLQRKFRVARGRQ